MTQGTSSAKAFHSKLFSELGYAHIQEVIEASDVGLCMLDAELVVLAWNRPLTDMIGKQDDEVLGHPVTRIVPQLSDPQFAQLVQAVIGNPQAPSEIVQMQAGLTFPVEQSITRLCSDDGQVEGLVLVFKDVSQSRKLAAQLNWQATHDPTTRLYNRSEFDRRLSQLLDEVEIEGSKHCLRYLDIDRFKVVNDNCGHVGGDELLRQVVSLIKHSIRRGDLLARIGGDEFAILLSNCSLEVAEQHC